MKSPTPTQIIALAALTSATILSPAAHADITGFNNLEGWSYNQSDNETPASLPDPETIHITGTGGTQTRSIFNTTRQEFSQFTASFTYSGSFVSQFGSNQGMSFVLQNDPAGAHAIGGNQGGLAYSGITNSIATTWNTRLNTIGFSTGGVVSAGVPVEGITLDGNNDIDFTLTYNGTFLTQRLIDTVTGVEFTQNLFVGDLSSALGGDLAYVGFGATSIGSDQVISNFSYTTVPTPGSVGVLTAGLFAATRRRRS